MRGAILTLAAASFLTSPISAQENYVPTPKDITTVLSKKFPGASITYKSTNTLCETTPGVNSYSGYVHLPSTLLKDVPITGYNVSLFFWYFQARNNPSKAPLSIYIAGGPGESSLDDTSGFPCTINPDSNSTTLNKDFSWNKNTNMLYIDQPIGTGFSYSVLANGIRDLVSPDPSRYFIPSTPDSHFKQTNITVTPATISLPLPQFHLSTTASAARTLWHFAQVWFQEFPEYINRTTNSEISIWANSYGGFFAPATFAHFERQNNLIKSAKLPAQTYKLLNLQTIGLTNPAIDSRIQMEYYPSFAYNNTYNIRAISKTALDSAMTNYTQPGGCRDLADACRTSGKQGDPFQTGLNTTVNQLCQIATISCFFNVQGVLEANSKLNPFDIGLTVPAQYPVMYNLAFYNRPWVQEALGVPLNHTMSSDFLVSLFFASGDAILRTYEDLEFLLKSGKNVVLVYGDRDYRCAWTGGEAVSLVLDHGDDAMTKRFRSAGYANITIGNGDRKGLVRQAGGLSFSRVFDAGHNVAAYQPEVVFNIFERAMNGLDVATGEKKVWSSSNGEDGDVDEEYATERPLDSFVVKNQTPRAEDLVEPVCLVYSARSTCSEGQVLALLDGSAVVSDFVVTSPTVGGDTGGDNGNGSGGGETDNGDGGGDGNGDGQQGGGEANTGDDKNNAALGGLGMMAGQVGVAGLAIALVVPILFL